MTDPILLLRCAYIYNILFLVPICLGLLFGKNEQVQGKQGLTYLLASMWISIVFCSILGIFYPTKFWSVLFLQMTYQFTYLCIFSLPLLIRNRMDEIPKSISLAYGITSMVYAIILTTYWFSNYGIS